MFSQAAVMKYERESLHRTNQWREFCSTINRRGVIHYWYQTTLCIWVFSAPPAPSLKLKEKELSEMFYGRNEINT